MAHAVLGEPGQPRSDQEVVLGARVGNTSSGSALPPAAECIDRAEVKKFDENRRGDEVFAELARVCAKILLCTGARTVMLRGNTHLCREQAICP